MKSWQRQERRIAKRTGGKQNPGSGSGWLHPNDVRTDEYLWEAKFGSKMVTIKGDDYEKLRRNALSTGRYPAMHIQIGRRHLVLHEEGQCPE